MNQSNSIFRTKAVQCVGITIFLILFAIKCSNNDNPAKPPTLDAPLLISPLNNVTGQIEPIKLKWTVVNDAALYEIQVSTGNSFTPIIADDSTLTADSTTLSGLAKNTGYFWRVRAKSSTAISPWTNSWKFTTRMASPNLLFPANGATGQPITPSMVWNRVAGATSYYIQISTNSTFSSTVSNDSTVIDTLLNSAVLSYATTFYWRVKSKNSGETTEWSAIWSFTTMADPTLGTPTLFGPASGAINQPQNLQLLWTSVAGAAVYELQIATDSSFSTMFYRDSTITQPNTSLSGLSGLTKYFWRVRAKNMTSVSAWSHTFSFTTLSVISIVVSAITILEIGGTAVEVQGTIHSDTGISGITMKVLTGAGDDASSGFNISFFSSYSGKKNVDLKADMSTTIRATSSALPGIYKLEITVSAGDVSFSDFKDFTVSNYFSLDTVTLGNMSNTLPGTIDLDSGILYTANQVTESSVGLIDICYGNGSGEDRLYVPEAAKYGTLDNKTMRTVSAGFSFTSSWPNAGYSPIVRINSITAAQFDATTTQAAAAALWDAVNEYVRAPVNTVGDCYLVRTSANAYVLIKVLSLIPGSTGTVEFKYAR